MNAEYQAPKLLVAPATRYQTAPTSEISRMFTPRNKRLRSNAATVVCSFERLRRSSAWNETMSTSRYAHRPTVRMRATSDESHSDAVANTASSRTSQAPRYAGATWALRRLVSSFRVQYRIAGRYS